MSTVPYVGSGGNPEQLYRAATRPSVRERLRAEVVAAYRPRVAALVRSLCRPYAEQWPDLEQAGAIGLLLALELYDPARGQFWTLAWRLVRNEITAAVQSGVTWGPRVNRGKSAARAANREAAKLMAAYVSLDDPDANGATLYDTAASDAPSPEALNVERERQTSLANFLDGLSHDDRRLALTENASSGRSRHYKHLVRQARIAFSTRAVR